MKQVVIVATLSGVAPEFTQEDLEGIARTLQTEVYSVLMFDRAYEFTEVHAVAVADGAVGATVTSKRPKHQPITR